MGDAAAERCDEFGWSPLGQVDPSLVAETSQSKTFGHGRAWSRTSTYTLRGDERSLFLVLTVEGGFEFTVGKDVITTEPGQMVFLDGQADTLARTLTDTARYVWFLQPTVLDLRRSRFALHEPLGMENAPLQGLIAMTNAILNTNSQLSAPAHGQAGLAAEHLIAAALDEAPHRTDIQAMHRDGLFTQAQLIIDAHFRDPRFGISELARAAHCSPRQIHAVFAAFGTTPRREIERRRLMDVQRYQQTTPSLREIIRDAGFLTLRTYRAALARQHRDQQSDHPSA